MTRVPLAFCFLFVSFPLSFSIVWLRFPWSFPWCVYFLCYIVLVNGLLPLSPTFGEERQTGNGKSSVPPLSR